MGTFGYIFRFHHSRVFPGVHPGSAPSHTQLVAPPACRIHGPHLVLPGRPHREVRVQCKFSRDQNYFLQFNVLLTLCRVFSSGCICGTFRGCVRSLPCPIPMSPFRQTPMPVSGTPGNLLPSHAASLICWYVFKNLNITQFLLGYILWSMYIVCDDLPTLVTSDRISAVFASRAAQFFSILFFSLKL